MYCIKLLWTLLLFQAYIAATAQNAPTKAWKNFTENSNNILLDFSYAGYNHGLSLPPDINTLDYQIYNITDYGAIPNDNKSDRKALETIIKEIEKEKGLRTPNANAIIYFPEGEFILHGPEDNIKNANGKDSSTTINIIMGNIILKGAGREKTTIKMTVPMQPTDEQILYSSPVMLSIRNNGIKFQDLKNYAQVTSPAYKNNFEVIVDNTNDLKVGDWILLYMENKEKEVILEELKGLQPTIGMTNLLNGIVVYDYHQIKKIDGNTITFEEPIMHDINPTYDWRLLEYRHYEGVGIEDITFEGNSTEYFHHHQSWEDDGGYKPINFVRLTNSWIRRVDFKSVSECITIQDCANVSCYDIEISGNRGHSAVRMANSSRGFIGKVYDHSDGYLDKDPNFKYYKLNLGQYHACGVSKHSIGNVIWKCQWGDDACFESHATQPRATLFDCCKGGFMQYRMGGAKNQLPNHLDDLTLWNFECTTTNPTEFPFEWWYPTEEKSFKTMPPTVVGFHGTNVQFKESQMKLNEGQGTVVTPYSLYEAQLERRLGYLPEWLTQTTLGTMELFLNEEKEFPTSYNLSGQRVYKSYKGIVIRNGKKYIQK